MPNATELALELERARGERPRDARRLERMLERVRELEETNPMLGTRGARLGIIAPEIYDVQVEAIMGAARAVQERRGEPPRVEIMIPLVARARDLGFGPPPLLPQSAWAVASLTLAGDEIPTPPAARENAASGIAFRLLRERRHLDCTNSGAR